MADSLLPFFNTAEESNEPISRLCKATEYICLTKEILALLVYEVMGRFRLTAVGFGNWDALG